MKKMILFLFLGLFVYGTFFLNITFVMSLIIWAASKIFRFDFDLWSSQFLINLISYSFVVGLGFSVWVTNREIDNGTFERGA